MANTTGTVTTTTAAPVAPAPSLTAALGNLVAQQPTGHAGSKPTSLGLSSCAVLRYLGHAGCRPVLAKAILAKLGVVVSTNTVQAQLASGRQGNNGSHGKLPTLSTQQQQQLALVCTQLTGSK